MLGAAGCGYNTNHVCPFLTGNNTLFDKQFTCLKYRQDLQKHSTTGEPFRAKICGELANAGGDAKYLKSRRKS